MKPDWVRVRLSSASKDGVELLGTTVEEARLHTICQSARCPNLSHCWGERIATFLLLGDLCTRRCGFCAVPTGWPGGRLDACEPVRVGEAARILGLRYVVLTSVDRDDLPDGGASQFVDTIEAVRSLLPGAAVEVLIPDYGPRELEGLLAAEPAVVGHNVETVARLSGDVRDPRASYEQSLQVLADVKRLDPRRLTKSSLLLGMGEELSEVEQALHDLREVGVDIVVMGQYLRPTPSQLAVARYVPPEEFSLLARKAEAMGFRGVVAAPMARTSYQAAKVYREIG